MATLFYAFFLLQFVSKSLDEVDSEEWVCSLGAEMAAQIPLYTHFPEEKVEYVNRLRIARKTIRQTKLKNACDQVRGAACRREGKKFPSTGATKNPKRVPDRKVCCP